MPLWSVAIANLVRESRRGDKEAFRELVERYQRKILAVAMGMVHNRDDALELTQETFVKAYENLDRFKGESSFYTWLYRIVVNLGDRLPSAGSAPAGTVSLADRPGGGEDVEATLPGPAPGRSVSARRARERSVERVQRSDRRVDPRSQSRHTSARSRRALLRRHQPGHAVFEGHGDEPPALRPQEAAGQD